MAHPVWYQSILLISFFASVLGLFCLYNHPTIRQEDLDETQWMLFAMSFAYWIVHCLAAALQNWINPDWSIVLLSLKFTAVVSGMLTFSCALSLPLNQMAIKEQVE
ncbi:hypothetical protein [Alkalinema sp. FACHB-956]|uniref:hypothetical protein n=1 Tax=Alkalinema sp. FACHB-956 TaxID=2692768 RepID=UPI00168630BA|nr:hypothetical protein [Alkalinema sp. FACHB-956]MBD2326865.1 hypothetical protein [Alkalinema sp. FACHB-956]